ncbi:hypothetical protein Q9L58_006400 [Maublancomyces gigas]|uniref:Uncharacterized protein n=1 Tax=Discina gigas TaxID=1032678 RepID=A0ABR3GFD4_9PEZI
MNDIQRDTQRMKIINSLLSPGHGRTDSPNAPSNPQQPDIVFSCTITNSRLDDELSVAVIELSNTPQWLQYLNDDPYGYPKKTAFGTLWKAVNRNAIDEHGRTEYIRAVMDGSLNLNYAEMLAEFSDTDVNIQDQDGRTALHWACVLNLSDIVRLCLSVPDCEVGLLDNDGLTAFDISLRNGNRIVTTSFYKSLFEIEETHPQEALLRVLTVSSESPADSPDFPGVAIFVPIKDQNKRLVKALIERGIDLKATDVGGDTALHIAAAGAKAVGGHMAACVGDDLPVNIAAANIVAIEIARMLLEAGSDVNAVGHGGATPMHHAVDTGDRMMVQTLLDWEPTPDAKDDKGKTALERAEENNDEDMVALLTGTNKDEPGVEFADGNQTQYKERQITVEDLVQQPEEDANIDELIALNAVSVISTDNLSVTLLQAVLSGELDTVQSLLDLGADTEAQNPHQETSLHIAAQRGYKDIAARLVAAGAQIEAAQVDKWTPLHIAARYGHTGTANMLVAAGAQIDALQVDKWTPLHIAARYGHTDTTKMLVAAGAQIDAVEVEEWTPLHMAACYGHTGTANMLVAAGAQIDAVQVDKWTPLHITARYGHTDTTKMLVAAGAQIEAVEVDKWTPLHIAARYGHTDTTKTLVAAGAQIDAVEVEEWTPLHMAARYGHTDTAKTLVAAGAQTDVLCSTGTPLELASRHGHTEIVDVLVAADERTAVAQNKSTSRVRDSFLRGLGLKAKPK